MDFLRTLVHSTVDLSQEKVQIKTDFLRTLVHSTVDLSQEKVPWRGNYMATKPTPKKQLGRPPKQPVEAKLKIVLAQEVAEPIWLSVSEAAKLGGVQNKTIRRALSSGSLKFNIVQNRYQINLGSVIKFFNAKTKLKNKFNQSGLGQYVSKWK